MPTKLTQETGASLILIILLFFICQLMIAPCAIAAKPADEPEIRQVWSDALTITNQAFKKSSTEKGSSAWNVFARQQQRIASLYRKYKHPRTAQFVASALPGKFNSMLLAGGVTQADVAPGHIYMKDDGSLLGWFDSHSPIRCKPDSKKYLQLLKKYGPVKGMPAKPIYKDGAAEPSAGEMLD